ncbi:MAG: restriction endonuclease [Candidatus Fluviicola riflensis]|nr:MAG: restriction endonuclease [Candidatus Fluviicola riflensis]OGS78202.1 MAG: restriction endonuclease [Candidatus Fluviicola riflensis]OGS85268.1 MAG: restriction endonuclease [Fluviicola sp. RIFCSPHIGHO2_01_FULL_43_53]OGS87310.1 MAG: restriction endonuclease [Fluviicola sp. RIFCSPHIGHO2_12_FULL_43_24]
MKEGQKLWTREELILAVNLYCKLPFGRLHRLNPEVIHLANLIGRTSSSVAYKLVNFASLDPSLKSRGIKGASNSSKLDAEIWNEFFNNWDILPFESEKLRANFEHTTIEQLNHIPEFELLKKGETREQIVKIRVNQSFFRKSILASYNNTCCITGIQQPECLIAGHIKPWSIDEKNRLNPQNGIAINALHDKAFETGLITITTDFKIKISPILFKQKKSKSIEDYFLKLDNQDIILPSRFFPDIEFLKYHNEMCFKY